MADISMGDLRFNLTADNSQFNDAIQKAQETQKAAAQDMGKQFEAASQKAESAFNRMIEKTIKSLATLRENLQKLSEAVTKAASDGADGAEKAFTEGFDAVFKDGGAFDKSFDYFQKKLSAGGGDITKLLSILLDGAKSFGLTDKFKTLFRDGILGGLDAFISNANIGERAGSIVDAFVGGTSQLKDSLKGTFDQGTLDETQNAVKSWAESIKSTINDMVDGVLTAIRKLRGTWDGIRDSVKTALDALNEANKNKAFQNGLIGLDDGGRSRAVAMAEALKAAGKTWDELNDKEKEALTTALDRNEAITNEGTALQKLVRDAQQYEQTVLSITSALKRQGETALANAGAGLGKSAYDRALERGNALAEGYGRGRNAGITQDPAVQDAIAAAAELQQKAANLKFQAELNEAIRQQTGSYQLQITTLGASAGETERLKFTQQELNKAMRDGVPVTDELRSIIDLSASAMGRAAQAAADAKEQFNSFKQVGQTVASSLESAFDKWISGTKLNFSEMVRGMAQDLAKLSFKKGIEGLLTGNSATGGGLFGALAGIFGGFRAGGGDVSNGSAYIVGERGPELFVPRGSGSIVSNQALQGGGSVPSVINMRIDLQGANGDETIARISAAAARQAFAQAVSQANANAPARQRQFQMLGA